MTPRISRVHGELLSKPGKDLAFFNAILSVLPPGREP